MKEQQDYDVTRVFESAKAKLSPKSKTQIKGRASKPDRGLDTEPRAPIGITGATTLS